MLPRSFLLPICLSKPSLAGSPHDSFLPSLPHLHNVSCFHYAARRAGSLSNCPASSIQNGTTILRPHHAGCNEYCIFLVTSAFSNRMPCLLFTCIFPEKQEPAYKGKYCAESVASGVTGTVYWLQNKKERRLCFYARTCTRATGEPDSACYHLGRSHAGNLLLYDNLALCILCDSRFCRDEAGRKIALLGVLY